MKKMMFLLAAAMLLSVSTSQAQIQWGVVAGTNLSKVNFSKDLDRFAHDNLKSKNMSGWYIGPKVNVKIPLVGLGLDAALEYSQKKLQSHDNTGSSSKTFRSVEIPINLRYNFGVGKLASVYLATGPQFGFNVGNKNWKWKNVESTYEETFKKSNMSTSWNVGAGVKVLSHLEVGLLYNIALSKYYKAAGSDDYNFKSNSFQIQAAILF